LYDADPQAKQVIDVAMGLEGLIRQDGIGAAAVVITPEPLTNFVPTQQKPDGPLITQYEKSTIEELGLLKMDFLGLRNLDIIENTLKMINYAIDIDNLPLDDPSVYKMLSDGDTVGVFQLQESGCRSLLRRLQPRNIEDLAAVLALYRPGPMASNMHLDYADRRNGRQAVTYFHPDAEEILSATYGICLFQEQLMRVAQKFAGYSMADADILRKIIGKKLIDQMIEERKKFIDGCVSQGYSDELGEQIFDMIEGFASYGFSSCLTDDTLVRLASGELASIATIEDRLIDGEEVLLESVIDGICFPDVCESVNYSGVQEVYEVTFDDESSIHATLDHEFMCVDGTYHTLSDIYNYDLELLCVDAHKTK
jgi:DNA polymerase-3 subunit alpha